jgi:alpha-1,6-mannosyltransferase
VKLEAKGGTLQSMRGLCGCAVALIGLALIARHAQWLDDFNLFVPTVWAQCLVYALSAFLLLQRWPSAGDGRILLAVILCVAVILRLIAFETPPNFLSTDVYRYVWDGRVQGAGINPYLYIPSDPAVASLRDDAIYPHINRLYSAPTIYPPFAQMAFFAITRFAESVNSMRLAMLGFEAIAVLALAVLLKRQRLPVHRLALYLWHPLPIWEFACGAHVDAVVLAMSLLAIIAAMSNRRSLSGALLAAAALTKFLPVAIAPALYRRWDWRMPTAFLVVVVCSYALYLSAGWKVLGFLESYAAEEGMTQGQGVFIAMLLQDIGLAPLPALLGFAAIASAVLGTMVIRALSRNRDMEAMPALAGGLAIATLVLISPHYSWYFCWLVPFICFLPRASLICLTSTVFYLYLTDEPFSLLTDLLIYAPALALFVFEPRRFFVPLLQQGSIP